MDIESSKPAEITGAVAGVDERGAVLDVEMELVGGARLDLILLGMGASDALEEVGPPFDLSAELTVLDKGN
jgi:hypothetical protein